MSKQANIFTKNVTLFFWFFWITLLLWQATFEQLIPDEAYYWLFGQRLDWGYFDHPPMVALLTKFGDFIHHSTWALRLPFVLLSCLTVFFAKKIIEPSNEIVFYGVVLSIVALQMGACLAVPDIPLLFFLSVYFFLLKKFFQKESFGISLLIGIVAAAMIYSKYHAFIVFLLTLLAVPDLLKNRKFYLTFIVAFVLCIPHVLWQINNNYPSVYFHLIDRHSENYSLQFTIDYLIGQFLFFGPFLSPFVFYAAYNYVSKNKFERILKFNFWGFILFFFLSSFKSRPETNWTVPALLPAIYFCYHFFENKIQFQSLLKWISLVSVCIVLIGKLYLTTTIFGQIGDEMHSYHYWKEWAAEVKEKASGRNVVFMNSYQFASVYMYYANEPAFTVNSAGLRKNQFDFWHDEEAMQNKPAIFFPNEWFHHSTDRLQTSKGDFGYLLYERMNVFTKIHYLPENSELEAKPFDTIVIHYTVRSSFTDTAKNHSLLKECNAEAYLSINFNDKYFGIYPTRENAFDHLQKGSADLKFVVPEKKGKYQLYVCLKGNNLIESGVGKKVIIHVS